MATNPPSTVRVTVGQNKSTVTALSYGTRTLKSASDLNMSNAQDGYSIVYVAATNSFEVAPASAALVTLDNGLF